MTGIEYADLTMLPLTKDEKLALYFALKFFEIDPPEETTFHTSSKEEFRVCLDYMTLVLGEPWKSQRDLLEDLEDMDIYIFKNKGVHEKHGPILALYDKRENEDKFNNGFFAGHPALIQPLSEFRFKDIQTKMQPFIDHYHKCKDEQKEELNKILKS